MDSLYSLLLCLESYVLFLNEGNQLAWSLNKNGCVSSFYHHLRGQDAEPISFPWKQIWKKKAIPRMAFLLWEVVRGKILTIDNLRRKGKVFGERVLLCQVPIEMQIHLLLCYRLEHLYGTLLWMYLA